MALLVSLGAVGCKRDRASDGKVTFNRDIAPVVYAACAECHRAGESGPFSLVTYEEVHDRASEVLLAVETRYMPPWKPRPGFGEFVDARRLSDDQVKLFRRWADDGFIEGDPDDLPPAPRWPEGWALGPPDLVLKMPEAYELRATGPDVFRTFVVPHPLTETRPVRAVVFRSGNPRAVHHCVITIDDTGMALYRDRQDATPGFESMFSTSSRIPGEQWLAWVPGKKYLGVKGYTWPLEPGMELLLNMHLQSTGKVENIQAEVGVYFADAPSPTTPVLITIESRRLDIPAGTRDFKVRRTWELPVGVDVLGVWPHAHYLGKELKSFAVLPDGTKKWLYYIDDWDFNWQDEYRYVEPVHLPKGSKWTIDYTYDNSDENERNPVHPAIDVKYGQQSKNEMGFVIAAVHPRGPDGAARLKKARSIAQFSWLVKDYEALVAADPKDLERNAQLVRYYFDLERWQEASKLLDEALKIDPKNVRAHLGRQELMRRSGKLDEAARYMQELLETVDAPEVRRELGTALAALGRPAEAVKHFRRAARDAPGFAETHNNLAMALAETGDPNAAVRELTTALDLWPAYPDANYNLGRLLQRQGKRQEAARRYLKAIQTKPDHHQAHNNLGILYAQDGKKAFAVKHFRTALRLDPGAQGTRRNLGLILGPPPRFGVEVKDDPAGLVVVRVIAESFAQKRGVRAGDRIVKLPGSDRPRQNQFGQLLQWSHLTAQPATITFSRDGETYEVVTASSPKASPPSDSLGTNGTNR